MKKYLRLTQYVVLLCMILVLIIFINKVGATTENITNTQTSTSDTNFSLYCTNVLAMDAESSNILYEKSGYDKVYPASTTKIMTAILAIENLNLSDKIEATKKALYSIPSDSSAMGIKVGEIFTVEELLYGLMLPSGNDAANVLAIATSGEINNFVSLMNEKAKELGCKNTHFVNAHGYFDENHYTTPYDMAIILQYALKNDTFRKIIETHTYTLPVTNKTDKEVVLTNSNKLFDKNNPKTYYEYVLGGKTGYTIESRGTFVGYAKKDDKLVIVAAFNGSQNVNGSQARFLDSITLWNYAFDNYKKDLILNKEDLKVAVIDKANKSKYIIKNDEELYSLIKKGNDKSLRIINYDINLDKDIIKNLSDKDNSNKDNLGNINITITGDNLNAQYTSKLSLKEKSTYHNFFNFTDILTRKNITYIVIFISFIILIICIKKLNKLNKNNKYNDIFTYSRRRKSRR